MSTFSKLDDLLTYIFKNDLDPDRLILNIEVPKDDSSEVGVDPEVSADLAPPASDPMDESLIIKESVERPVTVTIDNFSSPIEVEALVSNSKTNTIYVNECESLKNACGTGRIEAFGRTIYTNVCEMDDKLHIKLNVTALGESKEVDFEVKLLKDKPSDSPSILLSK